MQAIIQMSSKQDINVNYEWINIKNMLEIKYMSY